MKREYYFISDLHIGGDASLDICDFENELIAFFEMLKSRSKRCELIILGDAFGLWEMTQGSPLDKLKVIIKKHKRIFGQIKSLGQRIRITVLPGNHDYELACYSEYTEILKRYNMHLEKGPHIIREIAGKRIWIEHGSQYDDFNKVVHYGNPAAKPLGYYVTNKVVRGIASTPLAKKQRWLQDIESVYPTEDIPYFLFSNYFYKEMSPLLRYTIIPFLFFFFLSVVFYLGVFLEKFKLVSAGTFSGSFTQSFGVFGNVIDILFWVSSLLIVFFLVFSLPMYILYRDVKMTMKRYELQRNDMLDIQKREDYKRAYTSIFERNKNIHMFVYGHTHEPYVKKVQGDRVVANTGTWVKKLTYIPNKFFFLPGVYYPSHELSYVHIYEENNHVGVCLKMIPKKEKHHLTFLERLLSLKHKKYYQVPQTKKVLV